MKFLFVCISLHKTGILISNNSVTIQVFLLLLWLCHTIVLVRSLESSLNFVAVASEFPLVYMSTLEKCSFYPLTCLVWVRRRTEYPLEMQSTVLLV